MKTHTLSFASPFHLSLSHPSVSSTSDLISATVDAYVIGLAVLTRGCKIAPGRAQQRAPDSAEASTCGPLTDAPPAVDGATAINKVTPSPQALHTTLAVVLQAHCNAERTGAR